MVRSKGQRSRSCWTKYGQKGTLGILKAIVSKVRVTDKLPALEDHLVLAFIYCGDLVNLRIAFVVQTIQKSPD